MPCLRSRPQTCRTEWLAVGGIAPATSHPPFAGGEDCCTAVAGGLGPLPATGCVWCRGRPGRRSSGEDPACTLTTIFCHACGRHRDHPGEGEVGASATMMAPCRGPAVRLRWTSSCRASPCRCGALLRTRNVSRGDAPVPVTGERSCAPGPRPSSEPPPSSGPMLRDFAGVRSHPSRVSRTPTRTRRRSSTRNGLRRMTAFSPATASMAAVSE